MFYYNQHRWCVGHRGFAQGSPHPNAFRLLPSLATPVPPSSSQVMASDRRLDRPRTRLNTKPPLYLTHYVLVSVAVSQIKPTYHHRVHQKTLSSLGCALMLLWTLECFRSGGASARQKCPSAPEYTATHAQHMHVTRQEDRGGGGGGGTRFTRN